MVENMLFYCDLSQQVYMYLSSPIQVHKMWSFITEIADVANMSEEFGTDDKQNQS